MRRAPVTWLALILAISACAAPAQSPAPPPVAAAVPAAPAKPAPPASPVVNLQVGVLATASYGPFFIAQERGYYREEGLEVELITSLGATEQLPALAQGQLHVGSCASALACFNAINRRADVKIVADVQSAGKTEKSIGNSALVVRKDLWDSGAIREPKDLVGRKVYTPTGEGSAFHLRGVRWLERHGIDPQSVEWPPIAMPDIVAGMANGGIEIGFSVEPLLSAGLARGIHQVLATAEEMYPGEQALYMAYWTGIERLGPQVGERFMVAYLRGVRDYINAFEYGVDQDEVIRVLTENTVIKDPAVYRQIKYTWMDPNGVVDRASLESNAELLWTLRLTPEPLDLSQAFEDKYRHAAVQRLGEYQPPR